MSHHYIRKCRHCFTTVAQCRCGSNKTVQWTVCSKPACQAQEKAHVLAATRVDIGPSPGLVENKTQALMAPLAQANAQLLLAAERERQLAELLRATEEKLADVKRRARERLGHGSAGDYVVDGKEPEPHCFSSNSLGARP